MKTKIDLSSFHWFIEPLNEDTRLEIAKKLADELWQMPAMQDLEDDRNKSIRAWPVELIFITKLEKGKHSSELLYRTWRRPKNWGVVREWKFPKKDRKVKKAKKQSEI